MPPYNPLDKINLARSIEAELLARPIDLLSDVGRIVGAGVYAIYYDGPFPAYQPTVAKSREDPAARPIYVGKAIPKGSRKGGLHSDAARGKALADRLGQHASSIQECDNLEISHFFVRHLMVDDIWIPLGESVLIEKFKPAWNQAIDGFGNKDPGQRRATQYKSPWDVLHPGRSFSLKLADSPLTPDFLTQRLSDYFANRKLAKLPKKVAQEQAVEKVLGEAESDN